MACEYNLVVERREVWCHDMLTDFIRRLIHLQDHLAFVQILRRVHLKFVMQLAKTTKITLMSSFTIYTCYLKFSKHGI